MAVDNCSLSRADWLPLVQYFLVCKAVGFNVVDRDWEDMKKMPEHQTLVKDFKKIKYIAMFDRSLNYLLVTVYSHYNDMTLGEVKFR